MKKSIVQKQLTHTTFKTITMHEIILAVIEMREAQKNYYRTKTPLLLKRAIMTEVKVDRLLREHNVLAHPDPMQQTLFEL